MTDAANKPLEALRHALYSPPSPEGFSDILRLLADLSGQERDVALDFARAHLAQWPDHARVYTLVSPEPPVQRDAWRPLLQRAPWVAPLMLGARVPRRLPHRDPDGEPVPVHDVAVDPIGRYAWTLDARAPGGYGLWSLDTGLRPDPIRRHDAADGDWRLPHHALLAVHHAPPRLARVTTSPEQETRISGGDLHPDYTLKPQGVWARSRLDGFAVQLPAHPAHTPYAAAFSPDGAWFALASRSTSQVRVVHVGDSDPIYLVDLPHPEAVAFDLDRDVVFALGARGAVGAWSLTTRRLDRLDLPPLPDAHPIALALAGDLLVTVLADLPRIDARTRDVTLTVRAHRLRPGAVFAESTAAHTLRGRFVDLVASRAGELRLATLSAPAGDAQAPAWLTLTTFDPDASASAHSFGLPEPLPGARGALRLSPFGDLLVSAHPGHFTLWRTGAEWPPHVLSAS